MLLKIGKLILGKRPIVCAVAQDRFAPSALKKLKSTGIQLVEVRVDQFRKLDIGYIQEKILQLKKFGFTILLTVRDRKEGGEAKLSASERLAIFRTCGKLADAIDIELNSAICRKVIQFAKAHKKKTVVSFHDFRKTPPNERLNSYVKRAKSAGADIAKIACFAKDKSDLSRLLQFTVNCIHQNVIVIAMGKAGSVSRTLFPLCGSLVTYGFTGKSSAPGQPSAFQLAKFFHRS